MDFEGLSTYLHKGYQNAHPFLKFSTKIFIRRKSPLTYLELQSQMIPFLTEKLKNYFLSVCGMAYFTCQKGLSLIWNLSAKTQPILRKIRKIFSKGFLFQKHPLTCSHWERAFGDGNPEKRQKNLPAGSGGQGNISFLLFKYQRKNFNST